MAANVFRAALADSHYDTADVRLDNSAAAASRLNQCTVGLHSELTQLAKSPVPRSYFANSHAQSNGDFRVANEVTSNGFCVGLVLFCPSHQDLITAKSFPTPYVVIQPIEPKTWFAFRKISLDLILTDGAKHSQPAFFHLAHKPERQVVVTKVPYALWGPRPNKNKSTNLAADAIELVLKYIASITVHITSLRIQGDQSAVTLPLSLPLRTLPYEVLLAIFANVDLYTLITTQIKGVVDPYTVSVILGNRTRELISGWIKDVDKFHDVVESTHSLIGGSLALHVILAPTNWSPNDMDVIVNETHRKAMLEYLTADEGYVIEQQVELYYGPNMSVTRLAHPIDETKVDITTAHDRRGVTDVVRNYYASLVGNSIDCEGLSVLAPETTFAGVSLPKDVGGTRARQAIARYAARGYPTLSFMGQAVHLNDVPNIERRFENDCGGILRYPFSWGRHRITRSEWDHRHA